VIPPESVPDAQRAAGIITRGLAAVIDLLVVLLIMSGLYGGLILVKLVYSPAAFSLPSLNVVFSTLVTFVGLKSGNSFLTSVANLLEPGLPHSKKKM